jgi:tetratricopeptide (TPR) repeat protein
LSDLYVATGQKQKAAAAISNIVDELTKAAKEGEQSINHHADKELAYVYLLSNQPQKALEHALLEYNRRPDNIDVNEAVAWAYYKNDQAKKALPYLEKALSTNSKSPVLFTHAGLIFAKAGISTKAKFFLQAAQKDKPNIDLLLMQEAADVAQSLYGQNKR